MRFGSRVVVFVAVLAVGLALPTPAVSQVSVGLTGGLSLASLTGNDADDDLDTRTGFNVGGFVEIPLADIVWLVPGVSYVQKGATSDFPEGTIRNDYLSVPLLVRVGVSDRSLLGVNLYLGPTLAFQVSCEFDFASIPGTCEDQAGSNFAATKSFDFGLAVGAGLSFAVSPALKVLTNAFWDIGLTSIDDSPAEADWKNEAILLNVGFAWRPGA